MPTPKNDNKKPRTTDSKMIQELIVKLEDMVLKTEQFLNLPEKSKPYLRRYDHKATFL